LIEFIKVCYAYYEVDKKKQYINIDNELRIAFTNDSALKRGSFKVPFTFDSFGGKSTHGVNSVFI
jgi:hypothetical protein